MGMSGAEAAPGACPAFAATPLARTAPLITAGASSLRIIFASLRLLRSAGRPCRQTLRLLGATGRRRQRLADCQPHCGDLLLLFDDDSLRNAPQLLVVPVAQYGLRHVDRPLVVLRHHYGEVCVDLARRRDFHPDHHPRHRADNFGEERSLLRRGRAERRRADRPDVLAPGWRLARVRGRGGLWATETRGAPPTG